MRDKIRALEQHSQKLDPSPEERLGMYGQVQEYAEAFYRELSSKNTYVKDVGRQGLEVASITEGPVPFDELLSIFHDEVDRTGILPASGGQMGYIPGGGLFPSALGDFLAAVSNRYSGVAFAGPGAAEMEGALVRWMCRLAGFGETSSGDLTSGGSMATVSAMVTARDAHGIDHRVIPRSCVYLTAQAHHCIGTALHVTGLKHVQKRFVPMDKNFRMDTSALRGMIKTDREAGLLPWLVAAAAGTTDTGAVDPIEKVTAICSEFGLWFHLDAAYGGFFLLCDEGRTVLRGMEGADSIVMDPHKGLGLPYGTGAVLVKNRQLLADSYSYYADYMQDAIDDHRNLDGPFSPADYSAELTRHFRGPRMWFPLRLFGLEPFRAALAEKIWLARYFHREIGKMDGFEAGSFPDLSITTFRYVPQRGDADAFNRHLVDAVHADGKVFITSTIIDGRYTLRLAVLNFRTHLEQVDYLLSLLREKAGEINQHICGGT